MAITSAASNGHEPPPGNIIPPPLRSPSWFSSLPDDMVLLILAHVPKRLYPTLSCVSKNIRNRLQSPEILKTRSLLGKEDSLYISFFDRYSDEKTRFWFTLRRNENQSHHFSAVDLPFPYLSEPDPSVIAAGPEIFFICGSSSIPSSTMLIYDSRSGLFRRGPRMIKNRTENCVGLVGSKIYVIEGFSYEDESHQAESFDLNTQTWKQAPNPADEESGSWFWATRAVSLDRKVCALSFNQDNAVCYDVRDGSCESFELPTNFWRSTGVCVIENVLYVYYASLGLTWYDTKLRLWRVVSGLDHLEKVRSVGMAEYYGKMAFLWKDYGDLAFLPIDNGKTAFVWKGVGGMINSSESETKDIWCRMISLVRSEEGILGIEEAAQLLGSVRRGLRLEHCLSLSD